MQKIKSFFCRLMFWTLVVPPTVVILIAFFYQPSRDWPAQWLVKVESEPVKADAILLLMGDIGDRAPQAANLWKQGIAPKIVIAEDEKDELMRRGIQTPDAEATQRYLELLGVPASDIIINRMTANSSTKEEASSLFTTVEKELPTAQHLVVCTSWYHSSRAFWIFDKINQHRFKLSSLPSPAPKHWYLKEGDFLNVFNEYLKWFYHLLR